VSSFTTASSVVGILIWSELKRGPGNSGSYAAPFHAPAKRHRQTLNLWRVSSHKLADIAGDAATGHTGVRRVASVVRISQLRQRDGLGHGCLSRRRNGRLSMTYNKTRFSNSFGGDGTSWRNLL
jgi:hypothetical protein